MTGPVLRQATLADAPAICRVIQLHERFLTGRESPLTVDQIESAMTMPGRDGRYDFPAVERDGRIVGCGLVFALPPFSELTFGPSLDPSLSPSRQREVLRLLLEAFTAAAWQRTDGAEARQVFELAHEDTLAARFLAEQGFAPHRQTYEMEVVLPEAGRMPAPAWPDGVTGHAVRVGRDDAQVASVLNEAFLDHDGDHVHTAEQVGHWLAAPGARPDASFLVGVDGAPVGALLAVDQRDAGYVAAVGVRRQARRRGIGAALLRFSFAAFLAGGQHRVRLHVQVDNRTGALRVYERAGMLPTVVYDDWARPLPPRP